MVFLATIIFFSYDKPFVTFDNCMPKTATVSPGLNPA